MRATVEIVGIGQRKAGTSKKGVAYDMIPLCIAWEDRNFKGRACANVMCDGHEYDRSGVQVGEIRDVVMHEANFRLQLDAIL